MWRKVKTKSQKVFRANSYICGSYKGETSKGWAGGGGVGGLFAPILNRVKLKCPIEN